jgi:hypothetical protein
MKESSFDNVKLSLERACQALRLFTLGRHGSSQKDGVTGIQRVTACCNRMEKLFAGGPNGKKAIVIVASARSKVLAAQARLALVRDDR